MNTSTEHFLQCNQSEPLADASGRIVDLVNENGVQRAHIDYTRIHINPFSAGTVFIHQNLILTYKNDPTLTELVYS